MKEYTLTLQKDAVYEEVAKTTSYTGSKIDNDPNAYERIFTTDEDREMLERFWNESKNTICNSLKKFLVSEEETDGTYTLTLEFSSSFNDNLLASMERSLFSFFVRSITSKWYAFTNKEETADYSASAASDLDDILRKAYYKKKPTRPTYS